MAHELSNLTKRNWVLLAHSDESLDIEKWRRNLQALGCRKILNTMKEKLPGFQTFPQLLRENNRATSRKGLPNIFATWQEEEAKCRMLSAHGCL